MHYPHPQHGQPPNGSSATNGSFGGRREDEGDSDGRDDRDEHGRSPPAPATTDSIDPNLESEGTSHVRTSEPGKNSSALSDSPMKSEH